MKVSELPIDKIRPYPGNPRKNADAVQKVARSLKEYGWRQPIVVDEEFIVIAGHTRLLAAQSLGHLKVPVHVASGLSASQARAYRLADNRVAQEAEWDDDLLTAELLALQGESFDLTATGFDADEISALLEVPVEVLDSDDPSDLMEPPADPITAVGDVITLGRHRLMCGDSTSFEHVETLTGGVAPCMVYADPPYGIKHSGKGITANGVEGNDFGEILGDSDVTVAVDSIALAVSAYAEATLIFWGANYYASAVPNGYGWLVWDKQREGETFSGAELAFVNKGVRLDVFRHMWHGMVKASEHGQARVHPTQKPVALAEWCFAHYGEPKAVLDMFGGSGSTLIAAEKTGRTCYVMELSPAYCDVIVARWEKATGQKSVRP